MGKIHQIQTTILNKSIKKLLKCKIHQIQTTILNKSIKKLLFYLQLKKHQKQRQVSKTRNTLFWSEFWGLQTAFITFWTGLFFFQPIAADNEALQIFFTVELLFFNFIFLLAGIRWYCILKLMDVTDMINTKLLQGVPIDMLYFEISLKNRLKCIFPEWTEVKNLWSRKAWQDTVKTSIYKRRTMSSLSRNMAYTSEAQDHRFRLGNTEALHTNALNQLGIKSVRRDRGKKLGKRGKGKRKTSAKVHVSRKPSMLLHKQEKEVHLIQLRKEAGQRLLGLVYCQKAMDNLTDLFQGREEVEKKLEEEKLDSKIRLAKRLKKRNRKSLQFADLHIDLLKQIHTDTPEIVIANAIQNFREKMRNSDLIEN